MICGLFSLEFCEATRKVRALHAAKRLKKAGILARNKVLWLLIGSLTREKTSFAILIGRIIFFHVCKTLARTHLRVKILSEYISVYMK